ncbi:MAG: hypothetical protein FWC73_12505 [Defluviitaleaceae bacterium]|nr:hypothetical protein [Defluviitaleaceae bacterium]
MAKEKKKKKGSYGKVLGYCVAVGCVAALLAIFGGGLGFGGGGFGLPFGGGSGGSNGGNGTGYTNDSIIQNDDPEESDDTNNHEISEDGAFEESAILTIRVVNNRIYHGEDEITIDELVQLFDDLNYPDATWELRDEQAIMETFENVQALMRENGISYVVR